MSNFSLLETLSALKRKNIALIYAFQNEDAIGFGHYDYWHFDVISDWGRAVEQLGCTPYILDVRTFGHKALNDSLPSLDFIINLNAGNENLATLGLVPSLAGFIGVPCIPNSSLSIVAGESKILANKVAEAHGIAIPPCHNPSKGGGILRPDNLGSSRGVSILKKGIASKNELYQKFVKGVDYTVPLLFNPNTCQLEALPGIMYIPDNKNMSWFLDDEAKSQHQGYKKILVPVANCVERRFRLLAQSFQIKTLCRVDTRIECNSFEELISLKNEPIKLSKLQFIEINAMPTIKEGCNFCNAVGGVNPQMQLGQFFAESSAQIPDMTCTTFVLLCSICSCNVNK